MEKVLDRGWGRSGGGLEKALERRWGAERRDATVRHRDMACFSGCAWKPAGGAVGRGG